MAVRRIALAAALAVWLAACVSSQAASSGGAADADTVGASVDIRSVRSHPPKYPVEAVREGVSGMVEMQVEVGADGAFRDVRIVKSSGSALLDAAAMEAARHWRYAPARRNGKPVRGHVRIPQTFALQD
ncbi:energy transducer TonB [Luteimonas sp. gir]|uniref:energy transducer TonB n=1 Tax=Luteimonas sp. gir TaxID=3127960 RepID=UPI003075E40D